jgi:hypothetical protein
MGDKKKCPMHNIFQQNSGQTTGNASDKTQQVHLLTMIQLNCNSANQADEKCV